MAKMFDKIGKDSKDLLGKSMDTHRKFSFAKKDLGIPFLPKFTSETTDKGSLSSKFTLEGDVMAGVSMKNEGNVGLSSYSTEIGLNMQTLTKVDALAGLDLTITTDQDQSTSLKAEYANPMAAVCVSAGDITAIAKAKYSVGLAPVAGVNCGLSGAGAAPPTALALSYTQKGLFGCYLGLSGDGFAKVEARGIYTGIAGTSLAAKVSLSGSEFKGATVGGEYKVDSKTKVKVVTTDELALKAGLTKTLADGVSLTVGHAVDAKSIADLSSHKLGWTLEIK